MKNKTHWIIAFLAACIAACVLAGLIIFKETKRTMELTNDAVNDLDELSGQLADLQGAEDGSSLQSSAKEGLTGSAEGSAAFSDAMSENPSESVYEKTHPDMAGDETEAISETETVPASHHVIFVGDSRTVGMGKAEAHVSDRCAYIGESGEGYRWFIEYGIDLMDEAIRTWPDSPVVFNLGVNDCDHIHEYLEVYHEIEKAYPDTSFYYMSVNPVTEDSPHVPMSDILDFNRLLKAEFPWQYIDTCSKMLHDGFEDVDGVHYSGDEYRRIHDRAVLAILAMQETETEG